MGFLRIAAGLSVLALGCATGTGPREADYFRWIGFQGRGEMIALRWLDGQMPLRVHLPPVPAGLFPEPTAISDSVRDGIVDWTDVASPGIPRFVFVDEPSDADIRIDWAPEADGDWYVAFCSYNVNVVSRTFAVEKIVVTARWPGGRLADLHDVHAVMLHEMGHALGLGGHSPEPDDVMHKRGRVSELSDRDRRTLQRLYGRGNGRTIAGAKRDRR